MKEYKVVIFGSPSVGKSCITLQFVQGKFITKYDPTIEDVFRKEIEIDGERTILEILDTAGTEHASCMRDLYMKNGHGFIMVYSIASSSTFNDLIELKDNITSIKGTTHVPMVLVGNKIDLEEDRVVGQENGKTLARSWNCTFLEASAKSRVNIKEMFFDLIYQITRNNEEDNAIRTSKNKRPTQLRSKAPNSEPRLCCVLL